MGWTTLQILASLLIFPFVFIAVYLFIQDRRLRFMLQSTETALNKSREAERHLQTELDHAHTKLRQTQEDMVTGLMSWYLFEDRLNHGIKESERYQWTLGLLYIDLDDYAVIHTSLGVKTSYALLRQVANRLQSCVRQVDSLSRYTNDVFVAQLFQLSKPETAVVVAQRMLQVLSEPFQISGRELYVSASIGISLYPTDGTEPSILLKKAEQAMRIAKKNKHSYHFYQERMHEKSHHELALYTALSRESVWQEMELQYQPVKDVINENLYCLDVIPCWRHRELGEVCADDLFNLTARQHKQEAMAAWMLRNACRQFLAWRSIGLPAKLIAIPVSIKQLTSSQFIYQLSQILQELKFDPACLMLEIRDSAADFSFDVLEKAFNMLKYLGVKLCIDHFGSASLQLRYLKHIDINYIKLDKTLISDITRDKQAVAIVKAVLFLGRELNIQVIAQGVETKDEIEILKSLGCTLMQGGFLGLPSSEQQVTDNLSTSLI